MFRYVYGLVVLNHVSSPFDPVQLVPEINDLGFPAHVLSFRDFYNLNHILDTPVDLVNYFEARADVLIPSFQPKVHEEKAILDYYLEHLEDIASLCARHHGQDRPPEVFREHAETLRHIYRGDYAQELKVSRFIDRIIDRIHQVDESSPSPFEGGEHDYVPIATYLARLPRSRRLVYGRAFLDAIKRAGENNDLEFAQFSSAHRSECLLFLASPRTREQRKERNTELYEHLWLLKTTRQVQRAMGIATEAGFGKGRSYDFVLIESDPEDVASRPDYNEIKRNGEILFGTVQTR
jgi:hypothetical protein